MVLAVRKKWIVGLFLNLNATAQIGSLAPLFAVHFGFR